MMENEEEPVAFGRNNDEVENSVRIPRVPEAPTQAQIQEHRSRGHVPFRSWCVECIAGRMKNPPHRRSAKRGDGVPVVGFDYCFLRDDDDDKTLTVLVTKDMDSRVLFADVCPEKGATEFSVELAVANIDRLGRTRVAIKADQEPALTNLVSCIKRAREHETLTDKSPVGESASNGGTEKGVQQVEEQVRVLRLGLQQRLGQKVPTHHPVTAWLIPHATDVLSKLEVGSDGKTAYERLRNKKYRG